MRFAIAILCASLCGCAADEPAAQSFPRSWFWGFPQDLDRFDQMVGKAMPELKLQGWINGAHTTDDLRGKVLLLDFFATWCPPCIEGVPKTNELHTRYGDRDIVIVGICTSDTGQDKLPDFVQKHQVKYPVARDPGRATMKAWNVQTFPTYALVDRDGIVRAVGLKKAFLSKAIDRILEER